MGRLAADNPSTKHRYMSRPTHALGTASSRQQQLKSNCQHSFMDLKLCNLGDNSSSKYCVETPP